MPELDTLWGFHSSHVGLIMQPLTCDVLCIPFLLFFLCETGAHNFHIICVRVCGVWEDFYLEMLGWGEWRSWGPEVWELVDLNKVIKKCLGEEIRGTKGGSPRKGYKRDWLCIKDTYLTEACAWTPQSILSSFKPFLTIYLCHPCMWVLHGLTAS